MITMIAVTTCNASTIEIDEDTATVRMVLITAYYAQYCSWYFDSSYQTITMILAAVNPATSFCLLVRQKLQSCGAWGVGAPPSDAKQAPKPCFSARPCRPFVCTMADDKTPNMRCLGALHSPSKPRL